MSAEEKKRTALQKRELELRLLVRQMEFDRLGRGTVYQKLSHELREVREKLSASTVM